MKYLQKIAINRPVTTAMFYLLLILLGLISLKDLEVNLLPDMEFPRLTVITNFQNAAPEEVENLITKPLTEAVGTVKGIEKISSESMEGVSFVTLQFGWGTKIDYSAMEVREKIDLIRGILPEDAGKPIVTKFDPSQSAIQEIVFFRWISPERTNSEVLSKGKLKVIWIVWTESRSRKFPADSKKKY